MTGGVKGLEVNDDEGDKGVHYCMSSEEIVLSLMELTHHFCSSNYTCSCTEQLFRASNLSYSVLSLIKGNFDVIL